MTPSDARLVVCLGYPTHQRPEHVARLRAIDPGIEVVTLPVDPDSEWVTVPPADPHDEPPPWAVGAAAARRDALARAEVLFALHTPKDLMRLAPRLRWVQGVGAGVEQFARAGVSRARVVVTNASGVSAGSMAEFVIGRLLQVWKRFREADRHQREHAYVRTYGRTFAGSTVGIVGLGSIGDAVARCARALGARVLGLRRSAKPGDRAETVDVLYGPSGLHEMLARCDAVVVAAPATPETRHLIDAAALAAMKPGAVLVNVARGSLVDETALMAALRDGRVAAAALDVFEREPLPPESPLWDLPGVYVSAHSSVSVDRYLDDVFDLFADNLRRFTGGEPLRNVVDMRGLGFPE
jgi:phosphoglycerate dehydrogenase-like enzyme